MSAKTILSTIVALSVWAPMTFAQSNTMATPQKRHSVGLSVEPLWLLIGGLGAKIDFRVSDTMAIGLGGMYANWSTKSEDSTINDTAYKQKVYEIYMGPTFNLTGNYDTNGIFFTPAIGYTGSRIYDYSIFNLSGELNTFELRTTAGYQWVSNDLRIIAGGGFKFLGDSDVVVRDASQKEVYRSKSGSFGALALDFHIAWLF